MTEHKYATRNGDVINPTTEQHVLRNQCINCSTLLNAFCILQNTTSDSLVDQIAADGSTLQTT